MENILNVVSIFGHKIDWELDTALFWLFIVQAVLVVFLVIVFAVLLHRVGKNRSTVIVQSAAATEDKDVPKEEEQKPAEDTPVADETPAETEAALKEEKQPEEELTVVEEEAPAAEENEEQPTSEESKDAAEPEADTTCEEQPEDVQTDSPEQEPEAETTCEEEPEAEATCEEEPEAEAEQQDEEPRCEEETPEETPVAEETEPEEEPNKTLVAGEAEPEEEPASVLCDEVATVAQQEEQEDASCAAIESEDEDVLADEGALEEGILRYNKSFTARLILSGDDIKTWYTELKNELLSYKKVKSRMSWKRETFRLGRNVVATLGYRGNTLCIYLPLDPAEYLESKYKIEDVSEQVTYADTPCMYRLKNQKRVRYAAELFATVMEKMGGVRIDRASEDFYLPYESIDELLEKGLVKCIFKNSADEAIFLNNDSHGQPSVAPADEEATPAYEPAEENAEIGEDMQIDAVPHTFEEPNGESVEEPVEEPVEPVEEPVEPVEEPAEEPAEEPKEELVEPIEEPSVAEFSEDTDSEAAAADDIGTDEAQDAEDIDAVASDAEDLEDNGPDDDAETAQNGEEEPAFEDETTPNGPAPQIRWNGKNRKKHKSHR